MLSVSKAHQFLLPVLFGIALLSGLFIIGTIPTLAAQDGEADFTEGGYVVSEGEVTSVGVTVENTQTTEIVFGSEDVGYRAQFTVTDGNNDGDVSFTFNTLTAGDGDATNTFAVSNSADSLSISGGETVLSNRPLDQGVYDLTATVNGSQTSISVLTVLSRGADEISVSSLPASAEPTSTQAIRTVASNTSDVAVGDKFAVTIETSGLDQFLTDASIDDFQQSSSSEAQGITVQMRETTSPRNQDPSKFDVTSGELFKSPDTDTYILLFDSLDYPEITVGQEFAVTLSFTDEFPYAETEADAEEQTVSTNGSFSQQQIQLDDYDDRSEVVTVSSTTDIQISGTTTVAPGTEFNIKARSTGDTRPFIQEETLTVSETSTFATTLDVERLTPGAEFTLTFDKFGTFDVAVQLPTFDVDFTVADSSGTQIEDANITVDGTPSETSTSLEQGTHTIKASAPGYATTVKSVNIQSSTTVRLSLEKPTYPVTTTVLDERGEVIPNATVTVDGRTRNAQQSVALQSGTYNISASASNYTQSRIEFTVEDDSTAVTITLAEQSSESQEERNQSNITNTTNATNATNTTENTNSGGIISRILNLLPFF